MRASSAVWNRNSLKRLGIMAARKVRASRGRVEADINGDHGELVAARAADLSFGERRSSFTQGPHQVAQRLSQEYFP